MARDEQARSRFVRIGLKLGAANWLGVPLKGRSVVGDRLSVLWC